MKKPIEREVKKSYRERKEKRRKKLIERRKEKNKI